MKVLHNRIINEINADASSTFAMIGCNAKQNVKYEESEAKKNFSTTNEETNSILYG